MPESSPFELSVFWVSLRFQNAKPVDKQGGDLAATKLENLKLKAELRRVQEERDILKKAAAFFAKESG